MWSLKGLKAGGHWHQFHCTVFIFTKVWINQGDIILIGLRDYQDAKADVILRYNPDEARNLKAYGELPETGEAVCEWVNEGFLTSGSSSVASVCRATSEQL